MRKVVVAAAIGLVLIAGSEAVSARPVAQARPTKTTRCPRGQTAVSIRKKRRCVKARGFLPKVKHTLTSGSYISGGRSSSGR
jgi:hypothetical protein